jgi:hypothetical protein
MLPVPVKMSGKLRYLRNSTLNFLCKVHCINGATAPAMKKKRRP